MIRTRLSIMMFLEFFIWGAWLPPSFGYFGEGALNFTGWQQDLLNFSFPVAAIVAMFFGNQFVDRNFSAERFLAFSQFVGGLAILGFGVMAWMAFQTTPPKVPNFWLFFACMAIHCFFFVPTISVTNAIAFANITDAQKDFPIVRLFGTIGWIAASWPFVFLLIDWQAVSDKLAATQVQEGFVDWLGTALGTSLKGDALNQGKSWAFITSGIASILLAVYSLTLPHTPPKPAKAGNQLAWLEAMKLLKHPFLLVLFIVTFIDATVHDGFFFYAFTYLEKAVKIPPNWIQPAMSVGQIAEILTMAILGYVLKTLGWRFTMVIGILGHAARFAVFAFFPDPYFAVGINILHGVCYAFFFATLYIFVDEFFPKDARTSAQGLFNFLILGLGPIASRFVWRTLQDNYTVETVVDGATQKVVQYKQLLLYPAGAAVVAAVLLLLFFHPPAKPVPESVGH
jgi:MFS family permease